MMGASPMELNGWGWLAMGLFWLALILLAVARLLPATPRQVGTPPEHESALDVLDRRLAEGEIDMTTYQQTRTAITRPGRHTCPVAPATGPPRHPGGPDTS